jgi:hypothetical protein
MSSFVDSKKRRRKKEEEIVHLPCPHYLECAAYLVTKT